MIIQGRTQALASPHRWLGRQLGREPDRGLQRAILAPGTIRTSGCKILVATQRIAVVLRRNPYRIAMLYGPECCVADPRGNGIELDEGGTTAFATAFQDSCATGAVRAQPTRLPRRPTNADLRRGCHLSGPDRQGTADAEAQAKQLRMATLRLGAICG